MSAYYSQSITRMNGYSEGTSMSLAKFGGTMYLQGWFMNGFYVRCIRDGTDTGWKKITTS